jgi:hypothetical protein
MRRQHYVCVLYTTSSLKFGSCSAVVVTTCQVRSTHYMVDAPLATMSRLRVLAVDCYWSIRCSAHMVVVQLLNITTEAALWQYRTFIAQNGSIVAP